VSEHHRRSAALFLLSSVCGLAATLVHCRAASDESYLLHHRPPSEAAATLQVTEQPWIIGDASGEFALTSLVMLLILVAHERGLLGGKNWVPTLWAAGLLGVPSVCAVRDALVDVGELRRGAVQGLQHNDDLPVPFQANAIAIAIGAVHTCMPRSLSWRLVIAGCVTALVLLVAIVQLVRIPDHLWVVVLQVGSTLPGFVGGLSLGFCWRYFIGAHAGARVGARAGDDAADACADGPCRKASSAQTSQQCEVLLLA